MQFLEPKHGQQYISPFLVQNGPLHSSSISLSSIVIFFAAWLKNCLISPHHLWNYPLVVQHHCDGCHLVWDFFPFCSGGVVYWYKELAPFRDHR